MATQIQLRRGNTAQTATFTGAVAEVTVDTDKKTIVVHDGSTSGGIPLALESSLSANSTSVIAAFAKANAANVLAQAGSTLANTANTTADAAFAKANSANVLAQAGSTLANTANTTADAAFAKANSANVLAQAGSTLANTANTTADAAFAKANAANVLAQSAFARANNSLNVQSGGSVTGDVTVTGNLTIVGQTVYANTSTVVIADNILTLNSAIDQASSPTVNAGIEIDRGSSTNVSLLWNETSDTWVFTNDGSNYLEIADAARLNSAFALANTANIKVDSAYAFANTANIKVDSAYAFANIANIKVDSAYSFANAANVLAQAAFNKANSVASLAFSTVSANGTSLVAAANNDTLTISGANGVGVTGNATTDTFTINLTPTGVTSGTYGNSSTTVTLTVDAQGRVTSISQTALTYTETDPNALAFAIALG